ncbi:PAS domain S-box protein [Methylobacterium sp. J-068]|nr:PAS domain S-box protein [Methylobacterium sp. J-068]
MQVLVLVGDGPDVAAWPQAGDVDWSTLDLTVSVSADAPSAVERDADILVIAPTVADPLARARTFRQRRPSGQILFVVPDDRLDRMRRLLPFSPEISEAWVLGADVGVPELERLLREAATAVASRRAVKGLYGRINARFGKAIPVADAPEERRTRHLALAERYLAAILANAPDALVAVALDGAVVSWNEAAARVFGVSWDAVSGRAFFELFLPDDRANAVALLSQAGMGESIRSRELRIVGGDGSVLTLELSAGPVLGGGGSIEGVTLVARDVTDRRRDEESLRLLNEDLEGRIARAVAEREVTAAALRQAQKMEAVGQLTGGVAHDFNNLLTVIKSSIEMLARDDLADDRRKRYVAAISDTVDRAAKLTGQLLAFARRQPLKPEAFDAAERLRTVTEMMATIVGVRISIDTEVSSEACFVHADASQFETALVNMAVNARDAMDGEGALSLRLRDVPGIPAIRGHAPAPGDFVSVSVTDTGTGIPSNALDQIFEPFFTTKDVGKGTGLGLSQVYGFAKQSGGDIAVESVPGEGTTFTLYLPRIAPPAELAAARGVAAIPVLPGGSRRVLMVEDNLEVGRFATQILADLGHEVTWAVNAAEALSLLAEDSARFDIVFSDVVMPGMNGIELGLAIRRGYPGLPVVLASGYSHVLAEEGRHGFELVQKPYATGDISRVLGRMARPRSSGSDALDQAAGDRRGHADALRSRDRDQGGEHPGQQTDWVRAAST